MYLLCMNKNRLQARLGCCFFYKCVGLLSFSVTATIFHRCTKKRKNVGKLYDGWLIDHSIHLLTHVYMHLKTST